MNKERVKTPKCGSGNWNCPVEGPALRPLQLEGPSLKPQPFSPHPLSPSSPSPPGSFFDAPGGGSPLRAALGARPISWEKLNRGVSKPGRFPLFSGKVQIVSRTLSGLFLVGALNRPTKGKRTKRENPRTIPEQIGKIPEKSGKSQKGQKRTKKVQIGKPPPPFETPPLAALEYLWVLERGRVADQVGRQPISIGMKRCLWSLTLSAFSSVLAQHGLDDKDLGP